MRIFGIVTVILSVSIFAADAAAAADPIPPSIAAAVADSSRPEADRARDSNRKPGASVAFSGLKSGDKVADLLPGSGYFTRIFSVAVGPNGHVYAVASPRRPSAAPGSPDPAAAVQAIAADPHYGNVTVSVARVTELKLPEPVDVIWTSLNYHDIHNIPNADVGAFDKLVLDALKPGGVFIVLDHAAAAGSGFRDTSTLHRIDPEAVKKEVLGAGFKFEGESKLLHNPADPRTAAVFDPAVKGNTDQFILKFRKPN
jgi:predicted methyltransferase